MKIISNYHWHELLSVSDFTPSEQKEFDHYLDFLHPEDISNSFFRYRGNVYDTAEFTIVPPNLPTEKWHAISYDSAFSGIVIKYSEDSEQIQIGTLIL